MADLHTRLGDLAGPAVTPSGELVAADLARGRRALRRRRAGRIVTGSSVAVFAVALGAALTVGPTGGPAPAVGGGGPSAVARTQLVAYTGQQPAGFTLDEVPAGWEVQGVDRFALTLAPKGAADRDPRSFVGKIAIFLQSKVPDVPTKDVRVAGAPAVLATMRGETVPGTLFLRQPSGAYLTIQVWHGLGWGEDEIVRFAAGVHVSDDAGLTVG